MFKRKNESYDEYEKRIQRTAEILFPNTPADKPKKNEENIKPKNLPLGESIFDQEAYKNIINGKDKSKSELDALTDKKYNKKSLSKDEKKEKSMKDMTIEEQEEYLNDFYPSMKNMGKKKTDDGDDKIEIARNINKNFEKEKVNQYSNRNEDMIKKGETKIMDKNKLTGEKIDNTIFSDNARKKARNFIQGAEDFSEDAYQDEKGIWTIGYGHTKGVKPGDKITREEAEKLYVEDFKIHSEPLKHVKVPLNDNEKAALASLVFNIGEPQFKNSTVLRKLNEGDKKAAAEAFKLFCKESKTQIINGKPVKKLEFSKGLYKRRVREMELFLTPDDK